MSAVATEQPQRATTSRLVIFLGLVVVVFASVQAGLALAGGGSKLEVVLPIAAAAMLGMTMLALMRFELFVAAILLTRASLDSLKLGITGMDPAAILSVLFIVFGVFWLFAARGDAERGRSPLVRPLLAFTVAGALSLLSSSVWLTSAIGLLRLFTLVILLMVLHRLLATDRSIRLILGAVFASALLPMMVGSFQLVTGRGIHISGEFGRVEGTFLHPNPFAMFLTLLIVFGAGVYPHFPGRIRILLALSLVGAAGFLFQTYTRSAWIAAILGLIVVGFLQSKRLLAVLAIGVVLAVLAVPPSAFRLSDLEESTTASGAPANSLDWRYQYWEQVLALSTNPLLGIGLNAVQASTEVGKEPHNDFVRVYVETGIIGLGVYLWLLFSLGRVARRSLLVARPGLHRGIAVGFMGSLVALLLLSVVANVISQLVLLWYFAAIAAAAVAAGRVVTPLPLSQLNPSGHQPH